MTRAFTVDPATYRSHPLHRDACLWPETNCYVDLWIELLHALGHDPMAAMPFTVGIDFEGDQWTFFKFPLADLYDLYAIDVQELQIWRPLPEHLEEQLGQGRPVLVELDSFFLPDTAGTAYRTAHVKTTAAIVEIDVSRRRLGYFHAQGLYRLEGDDFDSILRLDGPPNPAVLPPYAEVVKARPTLLRTSYLVETSRRLLRRHLALVPAVNPFIRFKTRLDQDLRWLLDRDLEAFHQYSFATLRQFGSCFDLSASYLRWLTEHGEPDLEEPTHAFADLSEGAKTMQFQLARSMTRHKPLDLSPLDDMADRWVRATGTLTARYLAGASAA